MCLAAQVETNFSVRQSGSVVIGPFGGRDGPHPIKGASTFKIRRGWGNSIWIKDLV